LSVLCVVLSELTMECRFLIADDKQVKADRHGRPILEEGQRKEQPGLAGHYEKRGNVNGIAHPAIGTNGNETARCVPRSGGASPDNRENPNTGKI
jgi:hypothetical protein